MKAKESEKLGKYLDLAREQKRLWNMKIAISVVVGALTVIQTSVKKETKKQTKKHFEWVGKTHEE